MKAMPVKPIPVTNDEQRSILYWAVVGLGEALTRVEEELARHKAMIAIDQRHADSLAVTSFGGYTKKRHERVQHLEESVAKYHLLLRKLDALKQQADTVKIEADAQDIVAMVKENRRAEKRADDSKKVVGEG